MTAALEPDPYDLPTFFRPLAFDSLPSTNDEAKRRAEEGAGEGLLVISGEQTQGRGRRGRGWVSPKGNLYCSIVLRPSLPPQQAALAGFCAALAIADAIEVFAPAADVSLKWPNDVLVGGAKISGILLEASARAGEMVDWLVIGMGVNLASKPNEAGQRSAALNDVAEAGKITPDAFLAELGRSFEAWLVRWRKSGFGDLRLAWLAKAQGLGEPLQARLPAETIDGIFRGLDDLGGLLLELADGTVRTIHSGEVFFPSPE